MAKFFKSLKYIISGKDDSEHFTEGQNIPSPLTELQLFLQQEAVKIQEHIDYEDDLAGNLPRETSLIIKFDIETYIKEFEEFFIKKDFFSLNSDTVFHLLLQILVPPESTREILSKEFRKQIYIGMLINLSRYTAVSIQNLTKEYYERINKLTSENDIGKKDILDIFKDSIEMLEKSSREVPPPEISEEQIEIDTTSILLKAVKSFSLKTKQDIETLLYGNRFWGVFISIIFLFLVAALCLYYAEDLLSLFTENVPARTPITVFTSIITGIFVFIIMCRINSYIKARIKRKLFISTVNLLISELRINYGEVKTLFQNNFNFDIRRIPKLKKLIKKNE